MRSPLNACLPATLSAIIILIAGSTEIRTTAAGPAGSNVCVRDVGDLDNDGLNDYAVSRRATANAAVFLVHGDGHAPAIEDVQSGRRRAIAVLRGPAAAPYLCDESIETGAASAPRRRARRVSGQLAAASAERRPAYTVTDLDPLMPGYADGFSSVASALNERGQVVGRFFAPEGERAYAYEQGAVRDLGTLGGHLSAAYGVNDAGDVVGYSLTGAVDESGFVNGAFVYNEYGMQALGLDWSAARAINNAGQIVGEMRFSPGIDQLRAFFLDRAGPIDLGALPPYAGHPYSSATSVNAHGKVVGESRTWVPGVADPSAVHPATHAFVYENGTMRDLGTLGRACVPAPWGERCFDRSVATAMTDTGLIVGYSTTSAGGGTHAFVSGGDGLIDLGTLDGGETWAYGANASGQVVGAARTASGEYVPFLYEGGVMLDLRTLISSRPGSMPLAAYAINEFGQIAADHHLLTPEYDSAMPGRPFSFATTVDDRVTFEYWADGLPQPECAAGRVSLQVRVSGAQPGTWKRAATITDCAGEGTWRAAGVTVPARLRNTSARVDVRLVAGGAASSGIAYLRRFQTR